MAEILRFQRGKVVEPVAAAPASEANRRRLEGLAFVESEKAARLSVEDQERVQRYEIDKITFSMRRALDFIPTSLLREIADEVATEHEMMKR